MSEELDATYRLLHISANTEIQLASIIDAVYECIGMKHSSADSRIESIRKDETGYVFLVRQPEHADKLLTTGRLSVNSEELIVNSLAPGSHTLAISNLPLFITKEDVERSLLKYGTVRFVKSGLVVDDIRDGTFTANVVSNRKVPKKIRVVWHEKKYEGDVHVIAKVAEDSKTFCFVL